MRYRFPFVLAVCLLIVGLAPVSLAEDPAPEATHQATRAQQQNLQLVSEIGGKINAVATWTDYVFAGVGRRLVMVDVVDPSDPTLVWQSNALANSVNAVVVDSGKAYVGAGNTLAVFSINVSSTPPVALTGVFEFVTWDDPQYSATDVAVQGGTAYVTFARGDWWSGGEGLLQVIDVSVPTSPTGIATYDFDAFATSLALYSTYAIVCTRDGLTVVDVSDPNLPYVRGVSEEVLGGWDVAISGNYALVGTNFDSPAFRVIDISNPDAPSQVGSHDNRGLGSAYGVTVDAPYAYVTDTSGGLHILSISSPASPIEVGSYDLSDDPDGDHLAAWHVAVTGDMAYVVIDENSLHVVDIGDKADPSKLGSYEAYVADPTGVAVAGKYAYVTDDRRGLTILSVANPAAPQMIGVWEKDDPFMWPVDVDVVGDYAYVLGGFELIVIDVSNPAAPFEAGRYEDLSGGFTYLTVAGDTAYVIAMGKGLYVLDLSNPVVPAMVSTEAYDFGEGVGTYFLGRPFVRGTQLYLSCNGKLCVASVSDPANPSVQVKHVTAGFVSDVDMAPSATYLYAAEAYSSWSDVKPSGLRVLNADRSELGYVQIPSNCSDTYCPLQGALGDGGMAAYLVGEEPIVRVVDLRDASVPALAGSFDLPVGTDHVVADDDHAYVPLRGIGLMLFRYVPSTSRSISPLGGTLASTVDNTSYTFPPGVFTQAVTVTHTPLSDADTPATGSLLGIGHAYEVSAIDNASEESVEPSGPYTVTIAYSEAEVGAAIEDTLGLHVWDGASWVPEPTSELDPAENKVTAAPDHFSIWAVLGETRRVFLPLALRAH